MSSMCSRRTSLILHILDTSTCPSAVLFPALHVMPILDLEEAASLAGECLMKAGLDVDYSCLLSQGWQTIAYVFWIHIHN